ncbi:MAG: hypothetical protein LBH39_07900, partial [Clostridiales Family XIII bacterium]|nr:hypothetical protein [Clostridiales Family XIII bacterium]
MLRKRILAIITAIALIIAYIPYAPASSVSAADNGLSGTRADFPFRDHNVDAGDRMNDLISRMTLEEKFNGNTNIPRLGVNGGRGGGGEGLHGVAWSGRATVFPNSLGLSQTWDQDL